jgi:hypothetical protein
MIHKFTADACGKTLCPIADLNPFARWRKVESSIPGRSMAGESNVVDCTVTPNHALPLSLG